MKEIIKRLRHFWVGHKWFLCKDHCRFLHCTCGKQSAYEEDEEWWLS